MNKEEYYKRLEKTTEKIKTDRCSEDEIANINRQKLYLAEHYISSLEQENEKNKHYKTLYQSLKRQKEEFRDYLKARIEVCDNRLSSPFCNIEKATKERLILSQCLEWLEKIEGVSNE